jgi:hypothetical protein
MALDIDDAPSKDEMLAVMDHARQRLKLWRRRGLLSSLIFALCCGSVYPFLEGSPLHSYWDMIGKYLVLLSMAMLLVFVYCNALWWGAWSQLREYEKAYE